MRIRPLRMTLAVLLARIGTIDDLSRVTSWFGLSASLLWRGMKNPATGTALVRVAWRFRRRGWYARFPFLPLPARDYLKWRMYTAYGNENIVPPADDIVRYARWAVRDP